MRVVVMMAVVLAGALAYGQSAPVKMGLWEKTLVTSGGPGGDQTIKAKSCVTAETWEQMFANSQEQRTGCTNNMVKNAKGYTFDATCTFTGGSAVIHGTTTIQDAEHIVSETHSTSTIRGQKRETTMHSTSRFLGSDCGKVKPGDPEVEE